MLLLQYVPRRRINYFNEDSKVIRHSFTHSSVCSCITAPCWNGYGVNLLGHFHTCSDWNAFCYIILLKNIFIFPLSQSWRMLIGLSRACSHRDDTKETSPTLTAHNSAFSVLPVLDKGLSWTKSSPDLWGSSVYGSLQIGVLASISNISIFNSCTFFVVSGFYLSILTCASTSNSARLFKSIFLTI